MLRTSSRWCENMRNAYFITFDVSFDSGSGVFVERVMRASVNKSQFRAIHSTFTGYRGVI